MKRGRTNKGEPNDQNSIQQTAMQRNESARIAISTGRDVRGIGCGHGSRLEAIGAKPQMSEGKRLAR
jgi:hypothetical protein